MILNFLGIQAQQSHQKPLTVLEQAQTGSDSLSYNQVPKKILRYYFCSP